MTVPTPAATMPTSNATSTQLDEAPDAYGTKLCTKHSTELDVSNQRDETGTIGVSQLTISYVDIGCSLLGQSEVQLDLART